MFKILGSFLLIIGFGGLAIDKVKDEQLKILRLSKIRDFVMFLQKEIQYSNVPIPDICREYSTRAEKELKIFLMAVCEEITDNPGLSFEEVWNRQVEKYCGKEEEKRYLSELGKNFGFSNSGMQQAAIEQYLEELQKSILQREKKFQDDKKLILYFGAMSGLLLSIILL